MRSAPFKVLRQPGSPAVLVELGYISNAEDERLMASAAWQRTLGEGVANAVDEYFTKLRAGGK
jgi:N-acetylmuramoyl-L-alanine amidase